MSVLCNHHHLSAKNYKTVIDIFVDDYSKSEYFDAKNKEVVVAL
jgi:hypothetical protein